MAKQLDNGLPEIHRVITSHDDSGKAIFDDTIPTTQSWQEMHNRDRFCLGYTSSTFPVNLNNNADISSYSDYLVNKPGITIPGGTVLRIVDIAPGNTSPMHRTVSLDYGVVLEGEVELVLDDGAAKLLRRGDVAVQRATIHAWRNSSKEKWARMLYVLQEAVELEIGGKKLDEDYGGIEGVRASKS